MSWRQGAAKPTVKAKFDTNDDDWDTDLTYENTATEKSQRYGSASVPGSGRVDHVDFNSLQERMKTVDQTVKEDFKSKNPTRGYGGKYGTEQVMDKAAQDFSYKADVQKHSSQTDGKKGFGGQYGIDERAKDKSAETFNYKPTVEKHSSQTDYTTGFGSKKEESKSTTPTSPTVETSPKPSPPVASKPASTPVTTAPKPAPSPVATAPKPTPTPVTTAPKPTPTPVTTAPKPAAKPPVTEKPESTTSNTKADVGGIRARFENMNKQKEAEAEKRVAEERKKRSTADQSSKREPTTPNATVATEVKQQETPREPSPVRSATPPPSESLTNAVEEPVTSVEEPTKSSENQEQTDRIVGAVNVSAILRQRRDSSPSQDIPDDEWDEDD